MTRYYTEINCLPAREVGEVRAEFAEIVERVTDALEAAGAVIDLDLCANLETLQLDFTMAVDADTPGDALNRAVPTVRSVLSTAMTGTVWETAGIAPVRQVVQSEWSLTAA